MPHSCGHRACPHCQHHESQQWLERQLQRLVPSDYFLVTFTLPAEFLMLLLRHVLPRRFRRARNFGFLHPNSKRLIDLLHVLLKVHLADAAAWFRPRPTLTCTHCGGAMKILHTLLPPPRPRPDRPPLGTMECPAM